MDDGCGGVMKQSLREIGRPWRGPRICPVVAMWLSRNLARSRASGYKISVRQFDYRKHQFHTILGKEASYKLLGHSRSFTEGFCDLKGSQCSVM